ncbi:MAG UNVERIFIED_CONTAM: hypothetical protein LVR18_07120 [Planctomycetaceae bacterium]
MESPKFSREHPTGDTLAPVRKKMLAGTEHLTMQPPRRFPMLPERDIAGQHPVDDVPTNTW